MIYTEERDSSNENKLLFRRLFRIARRSSRLIFFTTVIGGVGAAILTSFAKPVYEGQFSIILSEPKSAFSASESLLASNPRLANIVGIGGATSNLATELKILESPIVLGKAFELFTSDNGHPTGEPTLFEDWIRSSIEINLEPGTSMVVVKYKDSSKQRLIKVLDVILAEFQEYSLRKSRIPLELSRAALEKVVNNYREKLRKSSLSLDLFALKYGIRPHERSDFLGSTNSYLELADLNKKLAKAKSLFTDNDPTVKILELEKTALEQYLSKSAGGVLNSIQVSPDNISKSRNQLLLDYGALKRSYENDLSALEIAEKSLIELKFNQAQNQSPWRSVKSPTLSRGQVSPRPVRSIAAGVLFGFLTGSIFAYISDRFSKFVTDIESFKSMLDINNAIDLSGSSSSDIKEKLSLIFLGSNSRRDSYILKPSKKSNTHLNSFVDSFTCLNPSNFYLCDAPSESFNGSDVFILGYANSHARHNLIDLKSKLDLIDFNQITLIWLREG